MTGNAVDHLLREDVLPVVWLGLPEWLQPCIRWIWKMFRTLVMWMLALTLPDDIKNGYRAKALLWGERLAILYGSKAHSPSTHTTIKHVPKFLPIGKHFTQGEEKLHELQRELARPTMCGVGKN